MQQQAIGSAKLRYLGVSAQKTRLVVDQVRGRNVDEVLGILRFSPKRVARSTKCSSERNASSYTPVCSHAMP